MVDRRVSIYNTATLLTSARSGRELVHGKPRRHDVRRILLVLQNHGVGPDVLEQQRLDEVHAQSISARQAMRRDILRDVRVPAEIVREPRRPRGGKDVRYARALFVPDAA